MTLVKLYAHKCSVRAVFWLIDNIPPIGNKPQWSINNVWLSPDMWWEATDSHRIEFVMYLINLNNPAREKTHEIEFRFLNEEDAVWFKTIWIT